MNPIILLDLNFTLVENSRDRWAFVKRGQYREWIERHERYRRWLVELIRPNHVILITARETKYVEVSLAAIERETAWRPQEWLFNPDPRSMEPHVWKEKALIEQVLPQHGPADPGKYLGLESNSMTRAMYSRHRVYAVPLKKGGFTDGLPKVPDEVPIVEGEPWWERRKKPPPDDQPRLF